MRTGAWHALPLSISDQYSIDASIPESAFDAALTHSAHPIFLYFHGNAASRLTGHRIHLARHISSLGLDMNFVAIDYRGFGDSSKVAPSEAGLTSDARATWDWLTLEKGVLASQIVVAGQSLGTGVATALVGNSLHQDNILPRALILTAPFSSIPSVLLTYKLVQIIPIMQPFNYFKSVRDYLITFLQTHFDTQATIQNVDCPILLIHSQNDAEVVSQHSRDIFDTLLAAEETVEPHITVNSTRIADFGILRSFAREGSSQSEGKPIVVHLETKFGGHNDVGYAETSLRVMKEVIRNGWR